MKTLWLTHWLAHALTATLAVGVALTLEQRFHRPPKPTTLVSLDTATLAAQFDDHLSDPRLSEAQREERLRHFSQLLQENVGTYERRTGAIVLKRDALLMPTHDITPEVASVLKRQLSSSNP